MIGKMESNPVSPYVRDHTDIHKNPVCNLHFAACFIYVSCENWTIKKAEGPEN